ncbi:MAG: hypothetical protein HFJ75_00165 [Eggerthellaceae bacterium]|nr:hypothetical protein [Eggerthellaceae bacterium]
MPKPETLYEEEHASRRLVLKRVAAIAAAILVLLFFQFVCPVPEGLPRTAMSAVGILLACIILWVSEAVPFIVTVVLIYFLLPVTGVLPYATTTLDDGTVVQSVFNQSSLMVPMYCLFIFAVTAAVMATPIPYRAARVVLKWSKGSAAKVVIGLMMATAIFSMFIADLAACAIFVGISLSLVEANGGVKKGSGLGKALVIGIPTAALVGGIGTPLGNSSNMLCIGLIESMMPVRVTFLGWCIANIPLSLVVTFLSSLWISKVFKLEAIRPEAMEAIERNLEGVKGVTTQEVKLAIWYCVAFGLMIASTWVPAINSILVSFAFTVIAFLPGIDLLTKEDFYKNIPWEIIMMVIGIQVLATGLMSTGVATWLVNTVFVGVEAWPVMLVVLAMCLVTLVLHAFIPIGPPVISCAVPIMVAVVTAVNAAAGGTVINPGLIACIGGGLGVVSTFVPLDSIILIGYEKGWISMGEWVAKAWMPTLILFVVSALWLPFATGFAFPM